MQRAGFLTSAGAAAAASFLKTVALADAIPATAPTLIPLIETLLPFDDPAFPKISSGAIADRIEAAFHLSESHIFGASLTAFYGSAFASLAFDERKSRVERWARSTIDAQRRFYQSVRFVTFAAFYSMPEAWNAIGYLGPFEESKR